MLRLLSASPSSTRSTRETPLSLHNARRCCNKVIKKQRWLTKANLACFSPASDFMSSQLRQRKHLISKQTVFAQSLRAYPTSLIISSILLTTFRILHEQQQQQTTPPNKNKPPSLPQPNFSLHLQTDRRSLLVIDCPYLKSPPTPQHRAGHACPSALSIYYVASQGSSPFCVIKTS